MLRRSAMEPKKSQLNPDAPVFIPQSQQFSQGKSRSHDCIPSDWKVHEDAYGQPSGVSSGPVALSDFEPFGSEEVSQFLELMEEPVPSENIERQPNRNHDDAAVVRSLAAKFPGYSEESVLDVYAANDGDMEATIEMLTQLEAFATVDNLPDTLGIGDTSTSWPSDAKIPGPSTDPGTSSGH